MLRLIGVWVVAGFRVAVVLCNFSFQQGSLGRARH